MFTQKNIQDGATIVGTALTALTAFGVADVSVASTIFTMGYSEYIAYAAQANLMPIKEAKKETLSSIIGSLI